MKAGDTFHYVRYETHLWIVLSDPEIDSDRVLLVNATSFRADKDKSCLLNPGDHECIVKNSCINYEDAEITTLAHLNYLYATSAIIPHSPLRPEILELVREKSSDSTRMKIGHWQMLIDQGLIGS